MKTANATIVLPMTPIRRESLNMSVLMERPNRRSNIGEVTKVAKAARQRTIVTKTPRGGRVRAESALRVSRYLLGSKKSDQSLFMLKI